MEGTDHGPDVLSSRRAIEDLLETYIDCVDDNRLEDWVELFAAEAEYKVLSRENVDNGLPAALVHDDTRDRIWDRVTLIREIWHGMYDPYWSRHLASSPTITEVEGGHEVRQNFALYITEHDVIGSRLLAVGRYQDLVIREGDVLRFRRRHVILDTQILPQYFVQPL